ncbi:MAG: DUF2914 domain-containing protein [Gammaproteobacteria bacterium]
MSDRKKIVIKINRSTSHQNRPSKRSVPKEITEWNIKRILGVLIVIFLGIVMLYYYLGNASNDAVEDSLVEAEQAIENVSSSHEDNKEEYNEKSQPAKSETADGHDNTSAHKEDAMAVAASSETDLKQAPKTPAKLEIATRDKRAEDTVRQTISHHKVTRALLARGMANKEPFKEIKTSIKVRKDKATGVFYFTEIKGMNGRHLYHQWVHEGRLVHKRPIEVRGNHWRVSTSKLFSFTRQGDWTVRLIDEEGKIYNEIRFKVIAE